MAMEWNKKVEGRSIGEWKYSVRVSVRDGTVELVSQNAGIIWRGTVDMARDLRAAIDEAIERAGAE